MILYKFAAVFIICFLVSSVSAVTAPVSTFVMNDTSSKILPQNMLTNTGTLFEDFENYSEWWTNGTGQATLDTVHYKTGVASLNITATPIATAGYREKAINSVIPGGSANTRLFAYWDDSNWNTTHNGGTLYFTSTPSGSLSSFFSATIGASQNAGWNTYNFVPSDWGNTGGESWSNTMKRLRVRTASGATTCITYSYDTLYTNISALPAAVINFDDGSIGVYTEAYPYMKARNITGTVYVVKDDVGTSGHMTAAQLQELNANGWAVASHASTNHTHMTNLSYSQQYAQIVENRDYITNTLGLPRASNDVAYPYGEYDNNTLLAVSNAGGVSGRTTHAYRNSVLPIGDIYQLNTYALTQDISVEKGYIDNAISRGEIVFLYGHNLSSEAVMPDANTMETKNFTAIVDYIHQTGIQTLSIDQFVNLQGSVAPVENPRESIGNYLSTIQFNDTSSNTPTSWVWNFGDGNTSTLQNPIHTFNPGNWSVVLTTTNTGGSNITPFKTYVNVTASPATTLQDIWMTQQYLLTLHVADAATGSAIASATWTDSTTQAITTTTNGTFFLTYPYGSLAGVVSATGYNSKVFSMVIDNDTTQTIQLTTATANPNQNTWYSPHQVRFEIHNDYGNRLDGISVSARAVGTTLPDEQVRTVYGINPDAANQMLNFTLLMNGTTGSDGAIVYTMLGSITYVMNMTNPADGTAFSTTVMPVDSQYILRMSSGSPLQNFSNASNVYNVLANTSLTFSEPNSSYVTMGLTYQDTTGTTTSLRFYVMAANNRTVMYTSNLGNPGRSVALANWTVANQRGQQYIWNYTAVRST